MDGLDDIRSSHDSQSMLLLYLYYVMLDVLALRRAIWSTSCTRWLLFLKVSHWYHPIWASWYSGWWYHLGLRGTQDGGTSEHGDAQDGSTSHGLDVPCSCGLAGAMVYIIPMLGLLALHVVSITTVVVWTTGCTRHLIHRHHVDLWTSDP